MADHSKRKYRNTLEFVESGFRACWENALDLNYASQKLHDGGFHATGLSLSVLALEELGKLTAIDGLLFSRQDDYKSAAFLKSNRSHASKLACFEFIPLLLLNLSRADPRSGKEKEFNLAIAIAVKNLKEAGNTVMTKLGEGSFLALDRWKQHGFYVSALEHEKRFITPSKAVSKELADAVRRLTHQAVMDFDFVLKDGNLERYVAQARAVRAALSEEKHRELERLGEKAMRTIFTDDSTDAKPQN